MLSSFERGIITLINNALNDTNNPPPDDFDYSKLYDFAAKQQIVPLIYYGARNDARFLTSDKADKLKYVAFYSAAISDHQMEEVDLICAEFDKNGLDYMKLKGTVLKKLYPHSDMRMMSDADILIREEQVDMINDVMHSFGYVFGVESDHEMIWTKGAVKIELHKRIVPSYNRDFFAHLGNGWKLARRKNDLSCEYIMSVEDEFVYLVTHFAKHYRDAGIGIRHATDIHVFMTNHRDIDMKYVNHALKQLGIYVFFVNVCKMLDVWFKDAECDEISEFLTKKIFRNGAYGCLQNGKKSQALVLSKGTGIAGAKRKKMMMIMFPAYKYMCSSYPWIEGKPGLLPLAWGIRAIKALLFKRDNIKLHRENIKSINKADIDAYQAELNYVGLDFNFEV